MNLTEQISRIKSMMGLIIENNRTLTHTFSKKKETDNYITFVDISLPFKPQFNDKIVLVNENNPNDVYTFVYGKDLLKSKFRDNEAYTKKVKQEFNTNPFENSQFIRDCVKDAFPKDQYVWQEDNEEFTEGLRGMYPFSNQDDWSVLNFFDTNPHRKKKLFQLFLDSGESDPKKWLVNFFKGGSKDLIYLTNLQRKAIQNSDKSEIDAMSLITNNFSASQVKGAKADRYSSIDAVDENTGETYQIKNIQSVTENVDDETGEIVWVVKGQYSRLKDYRNNKDLDNLAYYIPEMNVVYVFKNKDYEVKSNDLALHRIEPKIY